MTEKKMLEEWHKAKASVAKTCQNSAKEIKACTTSIQRDRQVTQQLGTAVSNGRNLKNQLDVDDNTLNCIKAALGLLEKSCILRLSRMPSQQDLSLNTIVFRQEGRDIIAYWSKNGKINNESLKMNDVDRKSLLDNLPKPNEKSSNENLRERIKKILSKYGYTHTTDVLDRNKFDSLSPVQKRDIQRSASTTFKIFQQYEMPKPFDVVKSFTVVYYLSHRFYHRSSFWKFDGPFAEEMNKDAFLTFWSGFSNRHTRRYQNPVRRYPDEKAQAEAVFDAATNTIELAEIPKKSSPAPSQ